MSLWLVVGWHGNRVEIVLQRETMKPMDRNDVIKRFKEALLSHNVYVCYQPQYNHVTGKMIGAEALMRWYDDEEGTISPSFFIPILEEENLIHDADLYVFEQICSFLKSCIDLDIPLIPISFNISRYDVFEHDYVSELEEIRKKYNVPVKYLRAEITESSAIGGLKLITSVLSKLHACGYIVEMDDFGSGYSSLNILKDLPVDIIKLDMRFLKGNVEGRGGAILNMIAQMSKWLHTPLIAEGVETMSQADFMKSIGCNYIQGYLYAKPLMEKDFASLLKTTVVESPISVSDSTNLLDVQNFLNPDSLETKFFNTYVGPAVICVFYKSGYLNILRANDMYYKELGIKDHSLKSIRDVYREENTQIFRDAIKRAVISAKEEVCDTWIQVHDPESNGYKNVCVQNSISLMGFIEDRYILYVNIKNVTDEKSRLMSDKKGDNQDVSKVDYETYSSLEKLNLKERDYAKQKHSKRWLKEKKRYGFDPRETRNMEHYFYKWLYERVKLYKKLAFKKSNIENTSIIISGVELTQSEWIDILIDNLEYLLSQNINELSDSEMQRYFDRSNKSIDIWKRLMFYMWW